MWREMRESKKRLLTEKNKREMKEKGNGDERKEEWRRKRRTANVERSKKKQNENDY